MQPNKPFNPIARENARSGLTAALGVKTMTKEEAVAFLRARGFHAFEREWAMGETIGVASEPNGTAQGITVYARIVYIARQPNGWFVEELDATPSAQRTAEPKSLEAACADAVSLLSQNKTGVL